MRTLGIAGTAKNTGKTTTLNALIAEARGRGVRVAVTSIGYDGEAVDNVTGLPKPRIVVPPGTVVTTARSCLLGGGDGGGAGRRGGADGPDGSVAPAAAWEILESTGVVTPLGEVLIARARHGGPVVLAGPNKHHELVTVLERVEAFGPELTLVDGALNRLAPMSAASGLILATGAARTYDVPALVAETAAMEALLGLPRTPPTLDAGSPFATVATPFPTLADVVRAAEQLAGQGPLLLSGPMAAGELERCAGDPRVRGRVTSLVFADPIHLLLGGDPLAMTAALAALQRAGVDAAAAKTLPLVAVTVNPFLPRFDGHIYVADAVPAGELRDAMRAALATPVVDVVQEGSGALWEVVVGSS